MSAVVSAVGSAFEAVGDAIGDVIEGVGDLAQNIVDEVVEPVVNAVDKTITAAMNDPVGTLLKVGVAVVAPELLPAVNFGYSVATGVPVEKAIVNAGVNMIAGDLGTQTGNYLTDTFDLSCAASNAATTATKGAIASTIKGQNAVCGAIGALTNSALNQGATSVYRGLNSGCVSTTGCESDTTQNTGLPVVIKGGSGDCVQGCASTTDLGATTGGLDTVNVTGGRDACTDLTCTADYRTTSADKGNVLITGKKDTCTDLTCMGCMTITGDRIKCAGGLGEVVITGKKDTCTDLGCTDCTDCTDCKTNLPTVVVTAKKDACEIVDCDTPCCDCCCDVNITLPKVKVKKKKTKIPVGGLAGAGCAAIPWLDTKAEMLKGGYKSDGKGNPVVPGLTQLKDMKNESCMSGVPEVDIDALGKLSTNFAKPSGYAAGGCISACYCLNNNPKYMPKFIQCGPDTIQSVASGKRQTLSPKQLMQIQQHISTMGNMGGLAQGGLPKKYHEAAPDGHNPEFVTGLTGYYACGGGTGQSDDIPAMLHDGDYVMDADVVAALGDGSSKAGRQILEGFRNQVPHKETAKGKPVPAKIADGEYVFPAGFVTALGGGDNKAGAKILDGLREKLREHKRSAPTSKIPPKAKSPLDYIEEAKG